MAGSSDPVTLKYKVAYVSSAEEVSSPDLDAITKALSSETGWVSSKYCHYPQEIIIKLNERSNVDNIRVLCHHIFIPSQIEFFVGTVGVGERLSWSKAKFDRMGYVNFRDNKDSGYKAREHKTVYVDSNGWFLKLSVHENYKNEYNKYNQVGVLGLSIVGYPLGDKDSEASGLSGEEEDYKEQIKKEKAKLRQPPLSAKEIRDLKSASDRSDAEEMKEVIKLLENKKKEAVREERFDRAKKYKNGSDRLKEALKDTDQLNTDKREAIEEENFDKAMQCKRDIDNIKRNTYNDVDLWNMLTDKEIRELGLDRNGPEQKPPSAVSKSGRGDRKRSNAFNDRENTVLPTIQAKQRQKAAEPARPQTPKEEKLPPIGSRSASVVSPVRQPSDVTNEIISPPYNPPPPNEPEQENSAAPIEDNQMVEDQGRGASNVADDEEGDDEEAIYRQLGEKEQMEYSQAISTFGAKIVRYCTSKKWESRQKGLEQVQQQMDESRSDERDDAYNRLSATLQLLRRGLKDKIFAVYRQAWQLLNFTLTSYLPRNQIVKTGGNLAAEKTYYILITRTGDTVTDPRFRSHTFENSLNIVENNDDQIRKAYAGCFVRPFKATGYQKIDQGHAELCEQMITNLAPNQAIDLTEAKVCPFAVSCLKHTDPNVRQSGIRMLTHIYKSGDKEKVAKYLPPDNETTKKKWPLYKIIFEEFDRIDGKQPAQQKTKGKQKSKEDDEVEKLKKQNKEIKAALAGRNGAGAAAATSSNNNNRRRSSEPSVNASDKLKENYTLLTERLQLVTYSNHEYDLQVVEISALKEHYLNDCAGSDQFQQCPRCKEPLLADEYKKHQVQQKCPIAKPPQVAERCLMCHKDVSPNSDQGWRKHLIGSAGCTGNPRKSFGVGAASDE